MQCLEYVSAELIQRRPAIPSWVVHMAPECILSGFGLQDDRRRYLEDVSDLSVWSRRWLGLIDQADRQLQQLSRLGVDQMAIATLACKLSTVLPDAFQRVLPEMRMQIATLPVVPGDENQVERVMNWLATRLSVRYSTLMPLRDLTEFEQPGSEPYWMTTVLLDSPEPFQDGGLSILETLYLSAVESQVDGPFVAMRTKYRQVCTLFDLSGAKALAKERLYLPEVHDARLRPVRPTDTSCLFPRMLGRRI